MHSKAVLLKAKFYPAPSDEVEFLEWCSEWDFVPLNGARRAWCPELNTYFRGALGVALTEAGDDLILVYADDIVEDE